MELTEHASATHKQTPHDEQLTALAGAMTMAGPRFLKNLLPLDPSLSPMFPAPGQPKSHYAVSRECQGQSDFALLLGIESAPRSSLDER